MCVQNLPIAAYRLVSILKKMQSCYHQKGHFSEEEAVVCIVGHFQQHRSSLLYSKTIQMSGTPPEPGGFLHLPGLLPFRKVDAEKDKKEDFGSNSIEEEVIR